jgi:hypothetical protein
MKKAMIISGFGILGIFALFGVFLATILFHEYTHVVQSKSSISINYDLNQPTFAHVLHDINEWNCHNEFKEFVIYSENSADKVEFGTGFVSAFLLGGSLFFLVFSRFKKNN